MRAVHKRAQEAVKGVPVDVQIKECESFLARARIHLEELDTCGQLEGENKHILGPDRPKDHQNSTRRHPEREKKTREDTRREKKRHEKIPRERKKTREDSWREKKRHEKTPGEEKRHEKIPRERKKRHEKIPRERKKNENGWEKEKKARNFGRSGGGAGGPGDHANLGPTHTADTHTATADTHTRRFELIGD